VVTVSVPKLIATCVPAGAGVTPSGITTCPDIVALVSLAAGNCRTMLARFGVVVDNCHEAAGGQG